MQQMNQTLTQESESVEGQAKSAGAALQAAEQTIAQLRADLDKRAAQLAELQAARAALAAQNVRGRC